MKFFGIAEQENETPSNTEEILSEFVKVNLKQPAEMFFERVHPGCQVSYFFLFFPIF